MGRFFGFIFKIIGFFTVLGLILGAVGMYFAGQWLQAEDEPAPCDAMVVLAGGLSRALYAADLYNEGMAPIIYIARTPISPNNQLLRDLGYDVPEREEAYRAILERKGVPAEAIQVYGDEVISTIEEAEALAQVVDAGSLLVVTSAFHVRRVKIIYSDVFPDRELVVCGSSYETFPEKWWTTQKSAMAVVSETAKTLFYLLGGRFRSTDSSEAEPLRYPLPEATGHE
ncbi:MAG: YdcF family protein [Desulfovibrio sp.]|nr:MAG: YdcF family protein [Desulfovibrio sp.]